MPFSHLDGDSFCGHVVYDPNKIAEYDSAHSKNEEAWVAGFDWSQHKAFLIDTSSYNDKTKSYERFVIVNKRFWWLPLYGFYHYYDMSIQTHHLVVSGQYLFIPHSYRIKITDDQLQRLVSNKPVQFVRDSFSGLILQHAYFPVIPKVIVNSCSGHSQCQLNYPKPTEYIKNDSRISFDSSFDPSANLSAYLVSTRYYLAMDTALFYGVELNEPLRAEDILFNYTKLSSYDNAKNDCWCRPRFFVRCLPGVYTVQEYKPPELPPFLGTTLIGLMTVISILSLYQSSLLEQFFHPQTTHISNILISPSHQSTLIAWGSTKFVGLFAYAGYPYFNSIIYDKANHYELITYINLPGTDPQRDLTDQEALQKLREQSVVPYSENHKEDIYTDDPPVPSFSVFAEQYMMFEGLIMGRVRPKNIIRHYLDYWYGKESDIILKPIKLTVKKSTGDDLSCYPIDINFTISSRKLNKFLAVDYGQSGSNPLLVFAEGKWNDTSLVLSSLKRPVLIAMSTVTNPIDELTDTVVRKLITSEEQQNTLTVTCYLLVQIVETKDFPSNPIKSLNSVHHYMLGYDLRKSDPHLWSSKYGVYNLASKRESVHQQILVKYTVELDSKVVSRINQLKTKLRAINAQVSDVQGNIIQGFRLKVNYPGHNGITEERLDISEDFTIEAKNLQVVYTNQYVGNAVFPHTLKIGNDIVWHSDKELIVYRVTPQSEGEQVKKYALPIPSGVVPNILTIDALTDIYQKVASSI